MSEGRRATLMPLGGGGSSDAAVDAKKRRTAEPLSLRLTFVLPESTESTCPVYNFKEELAVAKKRDKSKLQNGKTATTNGLDPFDDEDDDVKRIAMEMEAKYGTGPPAKKKRKNRRDDYADIGMGYDESDSFIDNTDGYDEMIPQNVTTLHGGFYINCGALEFKADEGVSSDLSSNSSESSSSSEDEDEEADSKKSGNKPTAPNRKRILDSSESEGENEAEKTDKTEKGNAEKKQKTHSVSNGVPPKKKKEGQPEKVLENHKDKPPPPPKKAPVPIPSTTSGKPSKDLAKDLLKKDELVSSLSVTPVHVTPPAPPGGDLLKDSLLKNVIELVASGDKKQTEVKSDKPVSCSDKPGKDLQLPANLPSNISDLIKRIKDNVQRNKDANKDVFNGNVNSLLITFERKSKVLGKQSRSRIYQHLASLMKMEKENLCKRAKNLVMAEDAKRLNTLLADLKTIVLKMMIPLWESYERETVRVMSLKTAETEESKNLRMPKRKFTWSDETRKMLREIIIIKKRLLIYEGKTKESIEIHLNLFIKSDVQVIWPDGWMTMAALFKLCSSFEKKPPGAINTSQELNSSSEAVVMPPPAGKPVTSTQSSMAQNQKLKDKKEKPKEMPTKGLSSKELQKFQANAISITPIGVPEASTTPPVVKKVLKTSNDLVANKIDCFEPPRGLSISQITSPVTHKSTIQARSIYKPEKQSTPPPVSDRTTKFVNLAQHNEPAPENLTKRMSTDYNIDSIMSRKSDPATPVKRSPNDIIVPKEEPDNGSPTSTMSTGTVIPIENFMPVPLAMDIKHEEEDVIILDDSTDEGQSAPTNMVKTSGNSSNSSADLRRKPGPKSKTKYVDSAMVKTAKSASIPSTVSSSSDKKSLKPDVSKDKKDKNEGDDIFKLMENLKELNKMTTPSKSIDTSPASAVSVIAFNKNFAKSPTTASTAATSANPTGKHDIPKASDYASGLTFNDVYQRHFLNSLSTTASTSTPAATSTAKSHNSAHTSSSGVPQEKHYNTNNNYATVPGQQSTKYKNTYPPHTGSFNLMDDMLANFITEYAYPKTANHKQKPTQK